MNYTKEVKEQIYNNALGVIEAKRLSKTAHFLKVETDLNERIDWLFRFKNVFNDNKEATLQKLHIVNENFKEDYSLEELESFENISRVIPDLSFKNAMNAYRAILVGFEEHLSILNDLESDTLVKTKKCKKKDTEFRATHQEVDRNEDGSPKLIHPIHRDIAIEYLDKYLSRYRTMIEVLIESFPEREEICKVIPENSEFVETRGQIPDWPVRKEFTVSYYQRNRSKIESQARRNKKGFIMEKSIYLELQKDLSPVLKHVNHKTIMGWVTKKGKK